ncbi:hypothetical protein [Clostridium perfringens]|uniref:hypothetical protein n=1 Tax=Clostridium perfringens TaxID=1502 RepID=UPI0018E46591|nr:hypothetical protein [Clostridium perfringens]MDM0483757.1 hypothetical protein [Clostridium perfringens]
MKNNSGLVIRNVIFSVVYNSSYFNSNFGLFWEPGAYQTFLNLALFFQLFLIRNLNYKRVGILLITIFTTFSTTGYIATIYIIVIFFVRQYTVKKNNYYKNKKINFIFIIILILGAVAFYNMPDVIKFKVLGKLEGIFNTHLLETNSSYESTLARINSFKIPIINLMKSPIWGVGFTNLSNSSKVIGSGFLTSTPLNWFALFGLVSGFIINMPIVMWTSFIKRNYILRIFLILFLIIIILSENYNRNMFFLILCFYGFDVKNAYYNY